MSLVRLSDTQKQLIKDLYSKFETSEEFRIIYNLQSLNARDKIELKDLGGKGFIYIKDTSQHNSWDITIEKRLIDYLENEKDLEQIYEPDPDSFIDYEKIQQFKEINNSSFDLSKLIQLLESINANYRMKYYYVVAILIRMVLDHSYPCFGNYNNFGEVASQYGGKSVKSAFHKLDQDARKIADNHTHSPISNKSVLPTKSSVDFKASFHFFLEELIKVLS